MVDIVHWPAGVLPPQSSPFDIRPFTRSGGRSLGGVQRVARTDRGYWVGSYTNVVFRRSRYEQERVWRALRVALSGMAGLIAVPVCSTATWAKQGLDFGTTAPHDDNAPFDDGAFYAQPSIEARVVTAASIGATSVVLQLSGQNDLTGIRFGYGYAMYETGRVISSPAPGQYQVEIFPAIRAPIPPGALLETDRPVVLCRLATDAEMDIDMMVTRLPRPTVNFVEAVDYWNDLALGRIPEPVVPSPINWSAFLLNDDGQTYAMTFDEGGVTYLGYGT